ncbi:uncharacterized protein EDB91DRAFT_153173 [Suillus paluster]|uniref:uncharacterized protein n=1 Tax=Suillus paluster TaxID=48578 RepID=UPI001B866916|nr:uncharacterized protein EDB91DRAFT_153173 [Suillus paluster]KAG1745539.1 hypothetical protein EDB91DRAFT_153173 [Suillus paluster]
MPATRSSSQQRSRPRANEPYTSPTRPRSKPRPIVATVAEVIVLSSDDENTRPSKAGASSRSKRKPSKKLVSTSEVLEISSSSSDEGPVLPKVKANGSESSASQREIAKLKHTNEHLERQLADHRLKLDHSRKQLKEQSQELAEKYQEIDAGRREIELQQQKLSTLQSKGTIDATKLEDMVSCDICAHLMYSPYLLLDCGHSYCERCLKSWFDETLTKYIRAHPTYIMDRDPVPPNFPHFLQTLAPYISLQLRTQLHATFNNFRQQQPEYTCPGCRKEVTGKPVVNYAIKDIVSVVGSVLGQPDTQREWSSTSGRGQQMGPFDGFFSR